MHGLQKKWKKIQALFVANPRHPSLHTELLEPKQNLIYSFRLNQQYRVLFFVHDDASIEVIKITNHYR
jgi:plasmid maintenance system killer protein